MVYTGKPSKGCAACRKRRIKCDEKKPACGGCTRVNQECPGYRNNFDLAWRDQTIVAKKGVERGKAKRKAAREELERKERERGRAGGSSGIKTSGNGGEMMMDRGSGIGTYGLENAVTHAPIPNSSTHSDSELIVTSTSNIPSSPESQPLLPAWQDSTNTPLPLDPYDTVIRPIPEEQALCFFFNNYVLPIRDPLARRGFMEYLGPVYSKSDSRSPVQVATLAISTCMMSGRMGRPADTPLSRSFYVRAVSRIKDRVSKQNDCTSDEMIMAVMLLQYYEVSTGYLKNRTTNPHPHLNGALALIRHRGPWAFTDYISRSILLYVRSMLVDAAFRTWSPVAPDVETWANYVPLSEQIPVFRFDTINLKLANLRASIPFITMSSNADLTSQIHQAILEGIEIDQQFSEWSNTLPDSWFSIRIYQDHGISPTLQLYQDYCDVYKSLFLASTWNKLRLSQIEVQIIFLACLSHLPSKPQNLECAQIYEQRIQKLADDICASVPFYLGDRMKPGRTGDPHVSYPRAPGRPPVMDHYQTGPAMGGLSIIQPLGTLMKLPIKLRPGQREWLAGQMARTARIYNIVNAPKG